jgi:hypothetical protein
MVALTLCCATVRRGTDEGARALDTVVSYQPVGEVPSCARYALRRGAGGLSFVERSPLGVETDFPVHWVDPAGDHFAIWDAPAAASEGFAREVWIPGDRRQPAYLFVYRAGLYELRESGGVKRPVPVIPIEARAKLEPLQVPPL